MTNVLKVLLMGSEKSGKTSALLRHCELTRPHNDSYISTIGVDFRVKKIMLSDEKMYKAQIWDTAGQDRFRSICNAYIRGAKGVILFYDVSSRESFEKITSILPDISNYSGNKNLPLMLVGSGVDRDDREISYFEGASLAQKINEPLGIPFFEISSKVNYNLDDAFFHMYEMAANLLPCRFNGTPMPWTTELHPLCIKDQKNIIKTILLYFSDPKHKLPNDIILYIFNFLHAAKHEQQWYESVPQGIARRIAQEPRCGVWGKNDKCICF